MVPSPMPRNRCRFATAALAFAWLVSSAGGHGVAAAGDVVDFARQVQPILLRACLRCHGPERQKGGLRLDRRESALKGGDSGEPAVAPGDLEAGTLVERVSSDDETVRMPPKGDRLTPGEVATLKRWIAAGAPWPESPGPAAKTGKPAEMVVTDADREHWAFRPLADVQPPARVDRHADRNPIDAFLGAALDAKRLAFAPEADRRTLARRVSFDLIGLPPIPEQVEAFVSDSSPVAYERLIDGLLADPRYGERWGRHWLDLARYGDSEGYERDDDRPGAYHYRDFVIRAFNADLPFDVFLRRQLAGDEDPSGDPQGPRGDRVPRGRAGRPHRHEARRGGAPLPL